MSMVGLTHCSSVTSSFWMYRVFYHRRVTLRILLGFPNFASSHFARQRQCANNVQRGNFIQNNVAVKLRQERAMVTKYVLLEFNNKSFCIDYIGDVLLEVSAIRTT